MASTNQLFIFGLFIAYTTFTVTAPEPYDLRIGRFRECQRRIANLSETVERCINDGFSPDEGYSTMGLYNRSTACLRCKHVCRRREQIKECLIQGVETVKEVSNKAKTMLPSSVHVAEAIANYFCDNEKEMFLGLTDEDMICLVYTWGYCNSALDFIHYKSDIVFCDSEDPLVNPYLYTMEYVCSNSAHFFECSINYSSLCSSRLASTFTALKPILLTSAPCAQYNVTGNEAE
ncbi:uncharacterized protein LOC124154390 isoform X1 [Ischnura elegans]|uniref:uncharacterized protein LOC124154390 isoform X1 n=1 Tax=Ischnura elegans TaxID=197161 RepID=UPI001ED8B37A|nr:uncharacterized protein LOC124154390 isoform X1 [Ischnura elegans]XP_046384039.1 uncharacterized protein LOC124154390 isoform X1 [Ischnura elegans]